MTRLPPPPPDRSDEQHRLGRREVGRWPGALRLAPGDDRDEVLMILAPL